MAPRGLGVGLLRRHKPAKLRLLNATPSMPRLPSQTSFASSWTERSEVTREVQLPKRVGILRLQAAEAVTG